MHSFHVARPATAGPDAKLDQFRAFVAVKDEFMPPPHPAWTAVGVSALIPDSALTESSSWPTRPSGASSPLRDAIRSALHHETDVDTLIPVDPRPGICSHAHADTAARKLPLPAGKSPARWCGRDSGDFGGSSLLRRTGCGRHGRYRLAVGYIVAPCNRAAMVPCPRSQ